MSVLYIEVKYARMVGPRIPLWRVKKDSPFHGNGRCPVCGDSTQSKSKCRFHITEHKGIMFCSCFNCGYKNSLVNFLKTYHTDLHSEFVFERYRVTGSTSPLISTSDPIDSSSSRTSDAAVKKFLLPLVSDLPETHPCTLYVKGRMLPTYEFYYAEKFFEFARQYKPDIEEDVKDGPRLVIPFFDRSGNIHAFQGRDLTNKSLLKYITITIDPKVPKIFGLHRLNRKNDVLIVEGPIDSLFLPNCVASVNASLIATATKLEKVINKSQVTIVYDNEPRNKVIVDHYTDAVKLGYKIVIWPPKVSNYKDINDMSKAGIDVLAVIQKNTFSGLIAQLELNKWKKV